MFTPAAASMLLKQVTKLSMCGAGRTSEIKETTLLRIMTQVSSKNTEYHSNKNVGKVLRQTAYWSNKPMIHVLLLLQNSPKSGN